MGILTRARNRVAKHLGLVLGLSAIKTEAHRYTPFLSNSGRSSFTHWYLVTLSIGLLFDAWIGVPIWWFICLFCLIVLSLAFLLKIFPTLRLHQRNCSIAFDQEAKARFDQKLASLQIDDVPSYVTALRESLLIQMTIFTVVTAFVVGLAVYYLATGADPLVVIICGLVACITALIVFRTVFWLWQLRQQRLAGIFDFLYWILNPRPQFLSDEASLTQSGSSKCPAKKTEENP